MPVRRRRGAPPVIEDCADVRAALALVSTGEAPYGIVYATDAAAEARYAFDGDTIGTLTFDLRTQRVEKVRGIDNFRLARGVFDNGRTFRQRRSAHDGHGSANADLIHHNMRAFQTSINRRLDITFFQLDFRTQLLKAGNV